MVLSFVLDSQHAAKVSKEQAPPLNPARSTPALRELRSCIHAAKYGLWGLSPELEEDPGAYAIGTVRFDFHD